MIGLVLGGLVGRGGRLEGSAPAHQRRAGHAQSLPQARGPDGERHRGQSRPDRDLRSGGEVLPHADHRVQDAVEGVDYDVERLTEVWRKTNEQDSAFVARAHAGVASPAFEPGPYAPNEYQVGAFVQWYVERVQEHLA